MLIGVIAEETLLPLVVSPPRWFDGGPLAQVVRQPDIFYQARSTIIGFIMPGVVDDTDVVTGAENFPHTYVTQDYFGIFPDLFNDTVPEAVYNFTSHFEPVLAPNIWFDFDFIWTPTIPVNPPLHPIGRHVDPDVIYPPIFFSGVFPGLVTDNDVIRASVIRRDGDDIVLLLETFVDADIISLPSMASALLPGVVNEHFPSGDVIYAAGQVAFLLPSAFNPADTFFTPFVFNQLNPSRVLDTDVVLGPELRTPGRMGLFVDVDIVLSASVQFAPLTPSLVVDTDIVLSVLSSSVPPIRPLDPNVDVDDTFYVPTMSQHQSLAPYFWPDIDTLLGVQSIILGQGLAPGVITDTDTLFAPTMPMVLSPPLFSVSDVFYTTTILNVTQFLAPSWIFQTETFFIPSIVAFSPFDGALALNGPIMPSTQQPTVILVES